MSQSQLTFDEDFSEDLFSDTELSTICNTTNTDSSSISIDVKEPEPANDIPEWKGMSMNEIRKSRGIYEYQEHPPIVASSHHTVLFALPLSARGSPKPYPTHQVDKWNQDYVRMPHSAHNLYPINQTSGNRCCRNRWEMIQEALLRNILSSQQFQNAVLSYNQIYAQRWNFTALHYLFSEVLNSEETTIFFETLMPKMVQLALQLPVLVTGAVPLLKRHTNGSISLSQLQVASLLANAFFCTFPRRNSSNPQSEYATYPYINFSRLFAAYDEEKHVQCKSVMEKIKCLVHYFRRVTSKGGAAPEGVITIERRYIPLEDCPKWNLQNQQLSPLHITSKGTIENEGAGLLQVDFANKYVGGAVLSLGCVQEEIRFVICPELMVTMLVTEALDDTEALIVTGIERYSKYGGYSNTFKWKGDFVDETPRDSSGRRLTSIVAIDALYFRQPSLQFNTSNITRELNKAYVGFVGSDINKDNLAAIATGNWGCGAFRGDPKLKVLIQLMAAAVANRSMVYFTFGDTGLRDDVAEMYAHLVQHDIDIARLYSMLLEYHRDSESNLNSNFYRFLFNRSKIKPLSRYLPVKLENCPAQISPKYSKDILPKRNENTSLSNKHIDNNRHLHSKTKEEKMTEEEKIMTWLESSDDDSDDGTKMNTHNNNDELKNTPKEKNTYKNNSIDKIADEDEKQQLVKTTTNEISDKSNNSVNSINTEKINIIKIIDDNDVSRKMKPTLSLGAVELNDNETIKILTDHSSESCKPKLSSKKSVQKKISDFFH